jgi:nitroreductase
MDNVPTLIAITSIGAAFQGLYDRHATYIDASLSLMTFVYSLETMGVSSCVINWPKVPKNDLLARKYIDLEESENIIMLLSVGYAENKGMIPYSQKMNNKNLIKYYE